MRHSDERVQEIFEATLELLGEKDYRRLTMLDLARTCRISKETLYNWFDNKAGLFAALIRTRSAPIVAEVDAALADAGEEPQEVLAAFCRQYLRTVLSDEAVRLNRVAIAGVQETPELAQLLVNNGRENALPPLRRYLDQLQHDGTLDSAASVESMAEALLGLAAGDTQIRRLLNALATPPDDATLERWADEAARRFLRAYGPSDETNRESELRSG